MMTSTALNDLSNQIGKQLVRLRLSVNREFRIHDAIAEALDSLGIEFEREHRLTGASRIDFFLPNEAIGIEVKRQSAGVNVVPQIGRYLEQSSLHGLILVANRIHPKIPAQLRGKPISHLALWRYHL
jgi:hypothetical protein